MWYWESMKKLPFLSLILGCSLCLLLFSSCNDTTINPALSFAYDDFGTEPAASRLLGPKGKDTLVVARFGSTSLTPPPGERDVRFVNMEQSMYFLRQSVRNLPKTPENGALHQRLSATYGRLYNAYSTKRSAFLSAPSSSYGRGGMNKAFMMPPMPPSI